MNQPITRSLEVYAHNSTRCCHSHCPGFLGTTDQKPIIYCLLSQAQGRRIRPIVRRWMYVDVCLSLYVDSCLSVYVDSCLSALVCTTKWPPRVWYIITPPTMNSPNSEFSRDCLDMPDTDMTVALRLPVSMETSHSCISLWSVQSTSSDADARLDRPDGLAVVRAVSSAQDLGGKARNQTIRQHLHAATAAVAAGRVMHHGSVEHGSIDRVVQRQWRGRWRRGRGMRRVIVTQQNVVEHSQCLIEVEVLAVPADGSRHRSGVIHASRAPLVDVRQVLLRGGQLARFVAAVTGAHRGKRIVVAQRREHRQREVLAVETADLCGQTLLLYAVERTLGVDRTDGRHGQRRRRSLLGRRRHVLRVGWLSGRLKHNSNKNYCNDNATNDFHRFPRTVENELAQDYTTKPIESSQIASSSV